MTKKILVAGASGGVGHRLCVLLVKVGETFYEPTGCLHRVAKKPGREWQDPRPGRRTAPAGRQAGDHSRAEEKVTPARP